MLLTITNTRRPATDLGFLLRKNPARLHSFDVSFGKAYLFCPEATDSCCTAALLLDVDPVGLVRSRVRLLQGSLLYRDRRLEGFDAAAVVEVVKHLDQPRLAAFERVLFECARSSKILITTPNAEFNVRFATLKAGQMRHKDHRFGWTRAQFQGWAHGAAERFGYTVTLKPIGTWEEQVGAPTQMGVFAR